MNRPLTQDQAAVLRAYNDRSKMWVAATLADLVVLWDSGYLNGSKVTPKGKRAIAAYDRLRAAQ